MTLHDVLVKHFHGTEEDAEFSIGHDINPEFCHEERDLVDALTAAGYGEPVRKTVYSYPSSSGLENRANSALIAIDLISNDTSIPASVRLVMIAQVMEREPVLICSSSAASGARKRARRWKR